MSSLGFVLYFPHQRKRYLKVSCFFADDKSQRNFSFTSCRLIDLKYKWPCIDCLRTVLQKKIFQIPFRFQNDSLNIKDKIIKLSHVFKKEELHMLLVFYNMYSIQQATLHSIYNESFVCHNFACSLTLHSLQPARS